MARSMYRTSAFVRYQWARGRSSKSLSRQSNDARVLKLDDCSRFDRRWRKPSESSETNLHQPCYSTVGRSHRGRPFCILAAPRRAHEKLAIDTLSNFETPPGQSTCDKFAKK